MRRVLLGALCVAVAACAMPPAASPTSPPTAPDQPPGQEGLIVDWDDPGKRVDLDDGWSIGACVGDAPILCVERNGQPVGIVEAASYDLDSIDGLDPSADVDTNLTILANGFFEAIGDDRSVGCGSDYQFLPIEPEPFVLANTPGMAFGFVGKLADGSASELNLQYSTIVGDRVVSLVAAAYDDGGCPGRDGLSGFSSGDLAEFQPLLESVLHESPLPDLGT